MDFKNNIYRIFTSLILLFVFVFIFLFYEKYLIFLAYFIYLIIFLELIFYFRKIILNLFVSLVYLLASFICLVLYFRDFYIKEELLFTILLICIFDISSFIFGRKFGKLKILPKISPNKTLFGLISGIFTSFLIALFINYYYKFIDTKLFFIFVFLILLSSFLGDIIESFFKRKSNLSTSSFFLPGHGGFFDRFDSLVMVVITLYLFKLIF